MELGTPSRTLRKGSFGLLPLSFIITLGVCGAEWKGRDLAV